MADLGLTSIHALRPPGQAGTHPSLRLMQQTVWIGHAQTVACQSSHFSFSRPNPKGNTSLEAALLVAWDHALPLIIRMESELGCVGRTERAQQHGPSNHVSQNSREAHRVEMCTGQECGREAQGPALICSSLCSKQLKGFSLKSTLP